MHTDKFTTNTILAIIINISFVKQYNTTPETLLFTNGEDINSASYIIDNLFDIPELFKLIQAESGTSWREMYKVFNMGHRMEIYMNPSAAEKAISISKKFNIDAKIIGRVEPQEKPQVHLKAPDGWHIYDIQ